MAVNPVGWFEIPVEDMDRARTFYEKVFDVELIMEKMDHAHLGQFPWDHEAKGCNGCLIKAEGYEPASIGTVVYFTAPGIEAHLERVEAAGGRILVPKLKVGEHGYIAHFLDTEGNRVAVHSRVG